MCGIAGVYRAQGVDARPVPAMVARLQHRGPDAQRWQAVGPADAPWAALGAARLAIVDPTHGGQPVSDEQGRFLVTMNGEIFNHRSLHKLLEAGGHHFQGHGDVEVLAALLASNPKALERDLSRTHGQMAAAIADVHERRLVLVRDRMGEKPLYWTTLPDGTLAWGSELKALLAHPQLAGTLAPDPRALQAVLLWEYVPSPWSAWRGIQKLEPGTLLIADARGQRVERWWQAPRPQPGAQGSVDRWADSLRNLLQLSTVQRLEADVEVGVLLSGGLDSSTVCALAQARSPRPLKSFSLSVDAPGFDEGAPARRVAAHLGTEHRAARLGPEDLPRLLDAIVASVDEPLADSSLVATWRLMELVGQARLKAVLSGDGADESFAGYPTCLAHQLAGPAEALRLPLGPLLSRLPVSHEGVSRDYMLRRFVQGLGRPWARRHQVWMGAWLPEELDLAPDIWSLVDACAAEAQDCDPASRAMFLDQRMYLGDGVLTKVDRASMAHGIEVRAPFLDHAVVELAASMSLGMKLHRGRGKRVLRQVARELLPADIVDRKKQGFGTPVGPWLRGPARSLLVGLPEAVEDLVPPERLRQVIAEHEAGRADHRRRLWSALVIARWRQGPWGPRAQEAWAK